MGKGLLGVVGMLAVGRRRVRCGGFKRTILYLTPYPADIEIAKGRRELPQRKITV